MQAITPESARRIVQAEPPKRVLGRKAPSTLDDISYADLVEYQNFGTLASSDYRRFCELSAAQALGCSAGDLGYLPAMDVAGVAHMVATELARISDLFKSCEVKPTGQESRANPPVGDWFSMVDWYAKRMGISDHNAAGAVKWQYFYRCAKIDAENNRYERRLMQVQQNDIKAKNRRI